MRGAIKYYIMSLLVVVLALATIFTQHKVECVVGAIVVFGIMTLVFWLEITKADKGRKEKEK